MLGSRVQARRISFTISLPARTRQGGEASCFDRDHRPWPPTFAAQSELSARPVCAMLPEDPYARPPNGNSCTRELMNADLRRRTDEVISRLTQLRDSL